MGRKRTLDMDPFPELTNEELYWKGELELPPWKNFWDHSEGRWESTTVALTVDCDDGAKPTSAQATACGLAIKHAKKIRDGILEVMLPHMQKLARNPRHKARLSEYLGAPLTELRQLRWLIPCPLLTIMGEEYDDTAYSYYDFYTFFDEDESIAVQVHGTRIVAAGPVEPMMDGVIVKRDIKQQKRKG